MNFFNLEEILESVCLNPESAGLIWATTDKMGQVVETLGERFKPAASVGTQLFQLVVLMSIAGLAIGTVCLLSRFFDLNRRQSERNDFRTIYRKLCSVHRLSFSERLLIRKIARRLELEDSLLLFVEPKYFLDILAKPDFEIDRTMIHAVFKKLFGFSPEPVKSEPEKLVPETDSHVAHATPPPPRIMRQTEKTGIASPAFKEEKPVAEIANEPVIAGKSDVGASQGVIRIVSAPEVTPPAPLSNKKVLAPAIPGSQAFSSIASTMVEVTTEIASKSIKNSLISGRENERKFKIHQGNARDIPNAGPVIPSHETLKTTVAEIVQAEHTNATPKKMHSIPLLPAQKRPPLFPPARVLPNVRQETPHSGKNKPKNRYGETFTMEDVAMLEAMVSKKDRKNSTSGK